MSFGSILAARPPSITAVVPMETPQLLTDQAPPEILMMSDDADKKLSTDSNGISPTESGSGTLDQTSGQTMAESNTLVAPLREDVVGSKMEGVNGDTDATSKEASPTVIEEQEAVPSSAALPVDPEKVHKLILYHKSNTVMHEECNYSKALLVQLPKNCSYLL